VTIRKTIAQTLSLLVFRFVLDNEARLEYESAKCVSGLLDVRIKEVVVYFVGNDRRVPRVCCIILINHGNLFDSFDIY
jgi:hypothetical protein